MSSRVLKKLHGEPDLKIQEEEDEASDLDNDLSGGAAGTPKKQTNVNRYDLVGVFNRFSPYRFPRPFVRSFCVCVGSLA